MQFLNQIILRTPTFPFTGSTNENLFNEAIYISSSNLFDELNKYGSGLLCNPKEIKKLQISRYKYKIRSKTRCTPFGLFAGLGIGAFAEQNNVVLNADLNSTIKRSTRLDMNVVCSLAQEFAKLPIIKPYLKFYPNTSIYQIGTSYRYIEYYYHKINRFHKISKVDFNEYVQNIFKESKIGLTCFDLTQMLIENGVEGQDAMCFVDELIDSQLLISQLEPNVTGPDFFSSLSLQLREINELHPNPELQEILQILNHVSLSLKALDENIFNDIEAYKNIFAELTQILPELTENNLFQTDLYKKCISSNLNKDIQDQLSKTILFLHKITPSPKYTNLEEFKRKFSNRYQDSEVPLLIALDKESGIGYPNNDISGINDLIDDINVNQNSNSSEIKWNLLESSILKVVNRAIKQNLKVIQIDENDFLGIDYSKAEMAPSMSISFSIIDAVENKIVFKEASGSSAINLLGRFAGGDQDVLNIVDTVADFEQRQMSDKILAEIVHLPESRTGNVLSRPVFRKYEIPYLAKSSVASEFQIEVNDLTLEVRNNSIILRCKKLNKEIIPRLGNAHFFSSDNLPVYQFLCDLQMQYIQKPFISFNWGALESQFSFLPRVEYQYVVLSPAKWRLKKVDFETILDKSKTDQEKKTLFFKLKSKLELPDKFLIVEEDNELLIDCNENIAVLTFIDMLKNKAEIMLKEYLFTYTNALIKDTNGNSYTNECIATILNEAKADGRFTTLANNKSEFTVKKVFVIGSEWLYFKIYCGIKTADYILSEKLGPITEELFNKKLIDKWFFIRYADPEPHLRFRVLVADPTNIGDIIILINHHFELLLGQFLISNIQVDTYTRELERYGNNTVEIAESIFHFDSVFVVEMLNLLDSESGGSIRWQVAIRSVDEFLNNFEFTLEQKSEFIQQLSLSFFNEHGGDKNLKLLLDAKFRILRKQIENILSTEKDNENEALPIISLLKERSLKIQPLASKLLELKKEKKLQVDLSNLLISYLHMNLDRLFMGRNRTNEFVVYDLLSKFYKSDLARKTLKNKLIHR